MAPGLSYEWNRDTGEFQTVLDPVQRQFEANWQQLEKILKGRKDAAMQTELLMEWPIDQERPSPNSLYNWLNHATAEKRVRREGRGLRNAPWRYRLPNEDDNYYDRGEMPPLRGIWER